MTSTTTAKPIGFDQVLVGDTITFGTRDNGFGGTGDIVRRTGVVFRKTDKVVDLHVEGGLPVFENGKSRIRGGTARLRRADWSSRSVTLTARAPLPYEVEYVVYVDHGNIVEALWTSDPELAANPKALSDKLADPRLEIDSIGTATRFTKAEGAGFSGWVAEGNGGHSDGIKGKAEALKQLKMVVAQHFNAHHGR